MTTKHQLLIPMAAYVFSLWFLGLFLFRTRIRSIKAGQVSPKYFLSFEGTPPPERVLLTAQHYDNQFQVPMLFLITCTLLVALDQVNSLTLAFAWSFVISRGFHSWIHLGSNHLKKRVAAFAMGWLIIILLWLQLLYLTLFSN